MSSDNFPASYVRFILLPSKDNISANNQDASIPEHSIRLNMIESLRQKVNKTVQRSNTTTSENDQIVFDIDIDVVDLRNTCHDKLHSDLRLKEALTYMHKLVIIAPFIHHYT